MTDPRTLWQSQRPLGAPSFEVERLAAQLEKRARRRNLREYLAAAITLPVCIALGISAQGAMGVSLALLGLGLAVMSWQLHRRATPLATNLGVPLLTHYRQSLAQQRDAMRSAWRWYLGPLAPGLVLFLAAYFVEVAPRSPRAMGMGILTSALCLATFIVIAWMNARAARKLDHELEAIERANEKSEP